MIMLWIVTIMLWILTRLLMILTRLMQQINRFVVNKNTQHVNAVYLCNFNKKKMVNNNIYKEFIYNERK